MRPSSPAGVPNLASRSFALRVYSAAAWDCLVSTGVKYEVGSLVTSIAGKRLDVIHGLETGKAHTDVLHVLRQEAKVRQQVEDIYIC